MATRSTQWWFEMCRIQLSDGTGPFRAIRSCPTDVQVYEAPDEVTAAGLCDELNAVILRRLGA